MVSFAVCSYCFIMVSDTCFLEKVPNATIKATGIRNEMISLIRQAYYNIVPIREIENTEFQQLVNLPAYKCNMSYCFNYGEFQKKDFGY